MKPAMIIALLASASPALAAKSEWKSVYTNTKKDCVTIQESNENSEIDFYEADCKSFGGYRLKIAGGDIRYAPQLSFNGTDLPMGQPEGFHDLGSDNVEWVYRRESQADGQGSIEWKGFIYRLNVSHGPDDSREVLYAVRLDGEKSCFLGYPASNREARAMVQNLSRPCLK